MNVRSEIAELNRIFKGKFLFRRRIGADGYGKVYAAINVTPGHRLEHVAVKILPENDDGLEAEIHKSLSGHQNIPRYIDAGKVNDVNYIAMEHVHGYSLKEFMEYAQKLPLSARIWVVEQAAYGVSHMHENNYLHLDLKPGNVLVGKDRIVKVSDFGLASGKGQKLKTGAFRTNEGVEGLRVAAAYAAPEIAVDQDKVDERADQYPLGCILYEITTGQRAFTGNDPMSLMIEKAGWTPPEAVEINPNIPEQLGDAMGIMMAANPDQRYESVAQAAQKMREARIELARSLI